MKKMMIHFVGAAIIIGLAATAYAASSKANCTVQEADGMNITLDCGEKGKRIPLDQPANVKEACTVKQVKENIVTLDCSNLVKVAHRVGIRVTSPVEGC